MADNETDQIDTTEVETSETPELSEMDQLKAEVDKWKSLSRKNEQQAKANLAAAKELEEIRKSQLTDTEKLVEQTKHETAQAIRREFATKLVDAELKATLNGRILDGGALLDFDKASFILDDGNIDSEAIQSWVEAHSKTADVPAPNLGQGNRGVNPSKAQIRTRDELKNMSPAEILEARREGRLDSLMGKL
jgi:hypothetical protein